MKNKFGRAAIFATIGTVLTYFFADIVNGVISGIGYFEGINFVFFLTNAMVAMAAFFLAVKFGSKLIFKKETPNSKLLLISVSAGLSEMVLQYIVTIDSNLLGYIITFGVFFGWAVLVDKNIEVAKSVNDGTTTTVTSTESPVNTFVFCSKCGGKNISEASFCRNCGSPLTAPNPAPASAQPKQPKVTANETISAQAQFAFNEKMAQIKETAIQIDDIVEAKLFAQAVELQLLKAPATAQFCSLEEMTVTATGDVYVVSGYVDSQNSYGAIVRTPFKITVFKDNGVWKNADKFVSTSSIIQGKIISHTIVWWILGIIGSIITFCIYYFAIMSNF